ncbi:unnamed protein product [Toxocara canis]|uniref:TSP1_CCN domain-containing protein n=1 Tax=Toxocara canis TaxID=6265 RepID=A0A183UK88_TOXCA|nr:unnamed protein product [Toxocara canis]
MEFGQVADPDDNKIVAESNAVVQNKSADPTDEAVEKKTEVGPADFNIGQFTQQRIIPLVNSSRVRMFAILNFFLFLLCIFLFFSLLSFAVYIGLMKIELSRLSYRKESPCLYQWTEWSACSATCKKGNKDPVRRRTVVRNSIIQAYGSRFAKCPKNLEKMVDFAPCNVYMCPKRLSSYKKWTRCFYANARMGANGGCYKMRDLPRDEQLIYIDTPDLMRYCTPDECSLV